MDATACFCDTGKPFVKCCKPFLEGSIQAKTPKQLMRSRYSAYSAGGFGDYLVATWHPNSRKGLDVATLSAKSHHWKSLEIVEAVQDNNWATVEFKAAFDNGTGTLEIHHELSQFTRNNGVWYYVDGTVALAAKR
ncbi:MAG: YchJ family protein [Pseudohongiellaceae bacterium]